jgi:hypothetical protein
MLKKAILATLLALPILLQVSPICAAPAGDHDKVLIAKKDKHKKDDGGYWLHDMQSGLNMAQQQNKLLFIDVGATW